MAQPGEFQPGINFASMGTDDNGYIAPLREGRYPLAIALPILAILVCILDIPPLIWHVRNRNIPAACLIIWLLVLNFLNIINPLIWPNDNLNEFWHGKGLCDIEIRIYIGSLVGVMGAILCISKGLARVLDTNRIVVIPNLAQRRRRYVLDALLCFGLPIFFMMTYYLVQPFRYGIWGVSGCIAPVANTWVTYVVLWIWPPILGLINAVYAGIIIYRIHRYRKEFSCLLSTNNTTKSRFYRLFLISLVLIVGIFPLEMYFLTENIGQKMEAYSWSSIHYLGWSDTIVLVESYGQVRPECWIWIVAGILVFCFFGVGTDATSMYRSWFSHLHLPLTSSSRLNDTGRSSSVSTYRVSWSGKMSSLFRKESQTTTLVSAGSH